MSPKNYFDWPKIEKLYKTGLAQTEIRSLELDQAVIIIGKLIDSSALLEKKEGLHHALSLINDLHEIDLPPKQETLLFYFVANAHSALWELSRGGKSKGHEQWYHNWENEDSEQVILNLRRAVNSVGFEEIQTQRQCQILTNLGNTFSAIGRSIEAIQIYDEALAKNSMFGMARGNRALALGAYANIFYDRGPALVFFRFAYADLATAVTGSVAEGRMEPDGLDAFHNYMEKLETFIGDKNERCQIPNLYKHSLGESATEREYRIWVLRKRLFLNPMNDLGAYAIAAQDILSTPPIITNIDTGPKYQGAFNQIKQGFVSARYLLYEGVQTNEFHFSDRDVLLVNTLDYPVYCLAIEKVKLSYRAFYSLFDQIAFLLNDYLNLGISDRSVNFRTLWYNQQQQKKGLRSDIFDRPNRALQALFWLSKDLYEQRDGFREALEPEARALNDIRNHIEHKYLKVLDYVIDEPSEIMNGISYDELAFSISRRDFESKALRLAQLARGAIIYLAFSMHLENVSKHESVNRDGKFTVPMWLDVWEDEWKQ